MGWPSSLTYREIAARNVPRSVAILACYGDVDTAADVFAASPALANDPEALANAAGRGHEAFVRLLLHHQPDLAQRIAVMARTRELTELLFRHGMDPNRPNWLRITPLHNFAAQGAIESAAIFLDHGADLHARDEELSSTPLGYAARAGRIRMVEFLLRRGARPTLPDDPPWATPLAWATRRGHHDIVRVLSEYERTGAVPGDGL
jgi:ankyrin repeat protein